MGVHVIIQNDDGETEEAMFCCEAHARKFCSTHGKIRWWEVFDRQGNMVDSADKFNEDAIEGDARQ